MTTMTVPAGTPGNLPAPQVQIAPADLVAKVASLPPITTAQQEAAFVHLLRFTSDLRTTIEAHYAPMIDLAHSAHKAALAARNQHTDALDDAERRLRRALAEWLDTPAAEVTQGTPRDSGVKLRRNVDLVIDDIHAIPREFLIPDEKKILKVLRAEVAVPGCRLETRTTVAVSKKGAV